MPQGEVNAGTYRIGQRVRYFLRFYLPKIDIKLLFSKHFKIY